MDKVLVGWLVGSTCIGGGIALTVSPFLLGRSWFQEFPHIVGGIFIAVFGAWCICKARGVDEDSGGELGG